MDRRVNQIMQLAMKQNNELKESIQKSVGQRMAINIEKCFEKNPTNVDNFSNCVNDKYKRVKQTVDTFEFRLLYMSKKTNDCLEKNKKSVKQCTEIISDSTKKMIQNLIKQIDKI